MPLPEPLLDAVGRVLELESEEPSSERRAKLLTKLREILDDWQRGHMSTADAVAALSDSARS
jgi:hypothetical protein